MSAFTSFSIVIPTRERCETLRHSIAACLLSDYPNFEIVVHDNASLDQTKDVVLSFSDKRVVYARSEKRVSMRMNFEAALDHVKNDYVIYIGDDDSVLPSCLHILDQIIKKHSVKAMSWEVPGYLWPSADAPGFLNLKRKKVFGDYEIKKTERIRRDLLSASRPNYIKCPLLYHGCVSREVIEHSRSILGNYFHYHIPDLFAAVSNLFQIDEFAKIQHPLSISGWSSASNGRSQFNGTKGDSTAEFSRFTLEAEQDPLDVHFHSSIRSLNFHTWQSLRIINEKLGAKLDINDEAWLQLSFEETKNNNFFHFSAKEMAPQDAMQQELKTKLQPFPDLDTTIKRDIAVPTQKFLRTACIVTKDEQDDIFGITRLLDQFIGSYSPKIKSYFTNISSTVLWFFAYITVYRSKNKYQ